MSERDSWRSEAAYAYVDTLNPSELAWEFLRRNSEYRSGYTKLLSSGGVTAEAERQFASHWGLRFRRGSDGSRRKPAGKMGRRYRSRHNSPRCQSRRTKRGGAQD